jgi:phosphoglycerate-specific signal transduction histidine kinase
MKTLRYFLVLWVSTGWAFQDVRFGPTDQRVKVYYGDRVYILADSAYVISMERAMLLNEKLRQLQTAQEVNVLLLQRHEALYQQVEEIERLLGQLLQRLQEEDRRIQLDMDALLANLDRSIAALELANRQLEVANSDLRQQLADLHQTVKHLRKEIRRIRWRGARDKVLFGVVGFFVGVAV